MIGDLAMIRPDLLAISGQFLTSAGQIARAPVSADPGSTNSITKSKIIILAFTPEVCFGTPDRLKRREGVKLPLIGHLATKND